MGEDEQEGFASAEPSPELLPPPPQSQLCMYLPVPEISGISTALLSGNLCVFHRRVYVGTPIAQDSLERWERKSPEQEKRQKSQATTQLGKSNQKFEAHPDHCSGNQAEESCDIRLAQEVVAISQL